MLIINHLSKSYEGQKKSLNDVSFVAKPNEVTVIIGPSGSGKTTLLRSINQLIRDDDGEIWFENYNICTLNKRDLKLLRRNIGMIFQNYNLIEPLTAIENVLHGRLADKSTIAGMFSLYSKVEKQEAFDLLTEVELADFAYKRCSELSGGQKQRVGIAKALMQHPKMILCDEPIASLDPRSTTIVMDILKRLSKEKNLIIIINLHQVEIAKQYADHIVGINSGKLIFDGNPEQLDEVTVNSIYQSSTILGG